MYCSDEDFKLLSELVVPMMFQTSRLSIVDSCTSLNVPHAFLFPCGENIFQSLQCNTVDFAQHLNNGLDNQGTVNIQKE